MTKPLDAREQRFVDEYLISLNPEDAALKAGYAKSTARTKAYLWVSRGKQNFKPHVLSAIDEAKLARLERTQIDSDFVLERMSEKLLADIGELFDRDGSLKSIHDWPLIFRQGLVTGFKSKDLFDDDGKVVGKVTEIKMSDRNKVLEMLGKHVSVQAFSEKREVTGRLPNDGRPIIDVTSPNADWIEIARRVAFMLATAAKMEEHVGPKVIQGKTDGAE